MDEEPTHVFDVYCRQCLTHRFDQGLLGAGRGLPKDVLDLREGFFDGVEIRGVGRQVDEITPSVLDELLYPPRAVRSEPVHHHYLPRAQGGGEYPLHVGFEHADGRSPFHGHGWPHPFRMKARQERRVRAAVSRNLEVRSFAHWSVSVKWSQRGVGAHLVHEHQPRGIDVTYLIAPQGSQELVPL